jgi:hypothetical protein
MIVNKKQMFAIVTTDPLSFVNFRHRFILSVIKKGLPFIDHQIYCFITKFSMKLLPTVFTLHLFFHHQI